MRLIPTPFLHVYSQTGPPREVECRDSYQLFAVKDGGITLSAFFKVLLQQANLLGCCQYYSISLMSKSNV